MFDFEPFWRLYDTGDWEPETREWVERVTRPGDLFVDVGAWCGPVSLWAIERGAYVIAIEPDPVAVGELRRVMSATARSPGFEIWEGAIVAEAGEDAYLAPNPKPGGEMGDSMSGIAPELTTSFPVPAFTLDAVLQGRTPDVVKVDVEGYETRLAPDLLPYLALVGARVQISTHGDALDEECMRGFTSTIFLPDARWGDWRLEP